MTVIRNAENITKPRRLMFEIIAAAGTIDVNMISTYRNGTVVIWRNLRH